MLTIKLKKKYISLPIQIRASMWFLVCSFMQKGISMITTPIFTRLMSTSEYGAYNVFNSWYGIISIIVALGLTGGVHVQGIVKFDEKKEVFSSSLQGLTTTLVFIWTIIYLLFKNYWNELLNLTTVQMLALLVMVWTSSVFGFWANEQRVTYSYRELVIVTIIVSLAKPIVGIIMVYNSNNKVLARILGLALVELVGYSWMYFIQMFRGKCFYSKEFWSYALKFNIPLIPHYLSQTVLNSADRIMIDSMVGESEAGIYSLAYSVALIMVLFNTALSQTITPWIYQKIKCKKIDDISSVAYSTMILIAVVNVFLILFAPEIIHIFAPSSYYDAIWIVPPVAISSFFMYCYDLFAKFEFYYEKTIFIMVASIAGAILNIVLNYIFIGIYGYIAAGYTTLVCYLLYCCMHYYFMRKICKEYCEGTYPYDNKVILAIFALFIVLSLMLTITYSSSIIRYIVIAGLMAVGVAFRKRIISLVRSLIDMRKRKQNDTL